MTDLLGYAPSHEHDLLRQTVRDLAEAKIAPAAAHVDAVGRASAALSRNVREDLLLEALMVELSGMDE